LRVLNAQPIRRQVVVAAILLLLPLVAAVIWSSNRTVHERELELQGEATSIASTAAAYLNQYLTGLDSLASALSRHPDVRALRGPESSGLFAALHAEQPLILNLMLTSPDGDICASALPIPDDRRGPVELPYVSQVVTTGRPVVSDFSLGRVTHKPTVVLGYPVRDDAGSVVGVLGFGVNLERLQTVFAAIPLPEGSVVTLTDRASRVLARSLEPERFIGTTVSAAASEAKDAPPTVIGTGVDGVVRIFGNAAVDRGPWLISVGIPKSVAMNRVSPLSRRNLAIAGFGILGTLLISLWLANTLADGLEHLRSAAQRIAAGDLSPPPRRTRVANLELAQLQDAFIMMAKNLRDTREKLDHQVEEERRMTETLQSLQRQVVRQERLTAVGLLVSGVAHELNNPLQAILGTLELLERHPGLSPSALEEVAFVKTQSGRAREIIRNLSRFSSQQKGPPALVDLRDVIAEIVQLRRRNLDSASITLTVEASSTRPVYANFTELEQVTLNFVINAQQSLESSERKKGAIVIRLYDVGRRVRLEVLDDGPGVSPEDEPKLFQPFFTTKPVGKGTGLGLSVSYGIIDSYGGSIGYRRNEWGGAMFFFELPASPDTPPHTEHDRPAVLHRSV
jgi:C4-dicarboxylate-specific signal transduction histidine kinase